MNQKAKGAQIGGITILVVFLVLCLAVFSVLSVASANADLKITRRAAAAAVEYYEADAKGQALLAKLDGQLKGLPDFAEPSDAYQVAKSDVQALFSESGLEHQIERGEDALLVSFTLPVGERRGIFAEVSVGFPRGEKARYEILAWRTLAIDEGEYAGGKLDLWRGEFPEEN